MKRVLVIGGSGFIGVNVVKYLLKKNYEVGIYDIKKGSCSDVEYHIGNIIDDIDFKNIVQHYTIIIYLISAIMPKKSMDEPMSSYMTDIPLLIHTLEICKENKVKRIIYASSGGTVYGDNTIANKENKLPEPINHYAICKLTCEKILCLYNKLYNMENIILRIANPFGFGQRLESGVGVITNFVRHTLKSREIVLYGDGESIRDFIDIEDVARAFQRSVEFKYIKDIVPIFNVGSGVGISLKEIIELISEELNISPSIRYVAPREFDVKCNYLDMDKSKTILGFEVERDIKQSICSYIKQLKLENVNIGEDKI